MSKGRFAVRYNVPSMALLAAGMCLFASPRALAATISLAPGSVTKLDNLNGDCQIAGSGDCETPSPLPGQFRVGVSSSAAPGSASSTARSFGLFDFTVDALGLHEIDVVAGASWSGFLTVSGDAVHTAAGVSMRLQILDVGSAGTPVVASQLVHQKEIHPEELIPGIPAGTKTETDNGLKTAQLLGVKVQGQRLYRVVLDVVTIAQAGAGIAGSDYRTGANEVVFDFPTVTVPENLERELLDVVRRIEDNLQTVNFKVDGLSGQVAGINPTLVALLSRIDGHEASEAGRFTELRALLQNLEQGGTDAPSQVDLEIHGDLSNGFGIVASAAGEPARIDFTSVLFLEHPRGLDQPAWVDVQHLTEITDFGQGVYHVRLKLARSHLRRGAGLVQFGVRHEDGKRVGTAVAYAERTPRPRSHALGEATPQQ